MADTACSLHSLSKIITNKYGHNPIKLGRNVKYKSKNSVNIQAITDENGICLGLSPIKGSSSEVSNVINVLDDINLDDCNKYKKSNRHKKYFIADAGYNSKNNMEYLENKGYVPIIWYNKRNTKNNKIIERNKIKGNKLKKYKTRYKADIFFSQLFLRNRRRIDTKTPRLAKIYDSNIENFINSIYLSIIDIAFGKCAFK